jgi:hypothetical protein
MLAFLMDWFLSDALGCKILLLGRFGLQPAAFQWAQQSFLH